MLVCLARVTKTINATAAILYQSAAVTTESQSDWSALANWRQTLATWQDVGKSDSKIPALNYLIDAI